MLITLAISTCEQIYQEEYKENEKESVVYSPCFLTQCKLRKKFLLVAKVAVKGNCFMAHQNINV